jgi:hypothetical protein
MSIQRFPSIQTALEPLQLHFSVSNAVPFPSISFLQRFNPSNFLKSFVVLPVLIFRSVAAALPVAVQTQPNHQRLCKRANFLVAIESKERIRVLALV